MSANLADAFRKVGVLMSNTPDNGFAAFLAQMKTTLDQVDRQLVTADDALMDLARASSAVDLAACFTTSEGRALFERLMAIVRSPPVSRSLDWQVADLLTDFAERSQLATVELGYPEVTFRHAARGYVGPAMCFYGLSMYCHHSEVPFHGIAVPFDEVEVQVGERWVPWATWCREASAQGRIVICGRCRRDTLVRPERFCGRRNLAP